MAFELPLDEKIRKAGWKVKIRDKERLEPPHVSILLGRNVWRLSLRTRIFLDEGHSWKQIDDRVRHAVEAGWDVLCKE